MPDPAGQCDRQWNAESHSLHRVQTRRFELPGGAYFIGVIILGFSEYIKPLASPSFHRIRSFCTASLLYACDGGNSSETGASRFLWEKVLAMNEMMLPSRMELWHLSTEH